MTQLPDFTDDNIKAWRKIAEGRPPVQPDATDPDYVGFTMPSLGKWQFLVTSVNGDYGNQTISTNEIIAAGEYSGMGEQGAMVVYISDLSFFRDAAIARPGTQRAGDGRIVWINLHPAQMGDVRRLIETDKALVSIHYTEEPNGSGRNYCASIMGKDTVFGA